MQYKCETFVACKKESNVRTVKGGRFACGFAFVHMGLELQ